MNMYSVKESSSVDSIMRSSTVQGVITYLKHGDVQVISNDNQALCIRTTCRDITLKEHSHGILSHFHLRQNYRSTEGNLKIILYKDRKTPKK